MSTPAKPPLSQILKTEVMVDVVDIGSNPIDAEPPYRDLLKAGRARVTGFEPNPDALALLEANKGDNEVYLPFAVADGKTHEFKICKEPGMSSLLEPNQDLLQYFHGFPDWGQVVSRQQIDTVQLDDIEDIENLDYLKIDIQGGELLVFENTTRRLSECVVIHTEVEFLRGRGFVFHRFAPLKSRVIQPLLMDNDIYHEFVQAF